MPYDSFKHHRRSIRLPGYDYTSPGGYYVTIDAHDRIHLFGETIDGTMHLNEWGEIADAFWRAIPEHFPNAELDEFIIMPNHLHGIIYIMSNDDNSVGARQCRAPTIPASTGGNDSSETTMRRAPTIPASTGGNGSFETTIRRAPTIPASTGGNDSSATTMRRAPTIPASTGGNDSSATTMRRAPTIPASTGGNGSFETTMPRAPTIPAPTGGNESFETTMRRVPTIPASTGGNRLFAATIRRAPTTEQFGQPVTGSIPTIIRTYKSAVTKRINQMRGTQGAMVWQRDYWEHIIRDEHELSRIRGYIRNNPI